jgi:ankyrin repeat protein
MKIKRNNIVLDFFQRLPNQPLGFSSFFKKHFQFKLNKLLTNSMEIFDYPKFKLALMLGANPNIDAQIKKDYHLVTRCARSGEALFLNTLIEFGGDVHANLPVGGYFPIHMAATKGMASTIEILVKHGANIHAVYHLEEIKPKDGYPLGWSALICACMQNKTEAVEKLLELGANPFDTNEKGISAIDICLKNNNSKLANILQEKQKHYKNNALS